MKYIILVHNSQKDHDAMAGTSDKPPALPAAELSAIGSFMETFNRELAESGEFVDAQGLAAPVHTRRIELEHGVPVVTDGPYAETQEVLAGYWIVRCDSLDRATEIATRLSTGPGPECVIDVRPILDAETTPEL